MTSQNLATNAMRDVTPQAALISRNEMQSLLSGKTLAFTSQPTFDARSKAVVLAAIAALHELDQTAHAVDGNLRLSDAGKAEDLADKAAPLIRRIAALWIDLDVMEAYAQAREDAHYAVPPLAASNAVGAIVDSEIRMRFTALSQAGRNKVIASMRGNELFDVAVAMLRSPFPVIDVSDEIRKAWRQLVDERAPTVRNEIDDERGNVRWARLILRRVAAMALAISGVSKVGLDRALAPSGAGADLFDFDPREVIAGMADDACSAARVASNNAPPPAGA